MRDQITSATSYRECCKVLKCSKAFSRCRGKELLRNTHRRESECIVSQPGNLDAEALGIIYRI